MRAIRTRALSSLTAGILVALAPAAATAQQPQTRVWNNPAGGSFQDPGNWSNGVPVTNDAAQFDYAGRPSYVVSFDRAATFGRMDVGDEDVTFDLAGFAVTATGKAPVAAGSFRFGTAAGQRARVHVVGGGTLAGFGFATLGGPADSSADVIVAGAATRWNVPLVVGSAGTARLEVMGGAQVTAPAGGASVQVGETASGRGELLVTGPGSRLSAGGVYVGGYQSPTGGQGTVSVLDGGTVQAGPFLLGYTVGGSGRAVVSGVNGAGRSTLQSSDLVVGARGDGSLLVQDGARVNAGGLRVALGPGPGTRDVVVGREAGGFKSEIFANRVEIARQTATGSPYAGSVTVNAGGLLDCVNSVLLGSERSGTGTLNVNGGAVRTFGLFVYRGDVNLTDGLFSAEQQRVGFYNGAPAVFTQRGGTNWGRGTPAAPVAAELTVGTPANSSNTGAGTYNLQGGTLVANVSNTARGTFNHSGGTLQGSVTNDGTYEVTPPPAGAAAAGGVPTVNGTTFRNGSAGTFRVGGGAAVRFNATFVNDGNFFSEGGHASFARFNASTTGAVDAAAGDELVVSEEFRGNSVRASAWDTSEAVLHFTGHTAGVPPFLLAMSGWDRGATWDGFINNYVWGAVRVDAGQPLKLETPSGDAARAIYVHELLLDGGVGQVQLVSSAGGPVKLYYDATRPANAYLGGQTYRGNNVTIEPVPEPAAAALLLPAAWVATMRRRPRRRGGEKQPLRISAASGRGAGRRA